jgi:hypothetical protein
MEIMKVVSMVIFALYSGGHDATVAGAVEAKSA